MRALQIGVALLCVVIIDCAVVNPDWETVPEWSFQVYLNQDTSIKCNDSMSMLMATDEIVWMAPDGSKFHGWSNTNNDKHALQNDNGIRGGTLVIKNVQESDSGLYYCHVYRGGNFLRKVNRAINLNGHLVRNQFDLYEVNVITAVVAALVFCIPFLFLCFLYHYRYRTPEQKQRNKEKEDYFHNLNLAIRNGEDYPEKPSEKGYRNGYDNVAYQNTHL